MLLCFLTEHQNKLRYGEIKEFCNRLGYVSQCVHVGKQLAKSKNKSTLVGNIARQILNKFGTLCWWIQLSTTAPGIGHACCQRHVHLS